MPALPLPSRPRLTAVALLAATAAWLLLLMRAVTGLGGMQAVSLPLDDPAVKQTGLGWRVPIPKEWRGEITAARGVVMEDGKPLHRRVGGRDVEQNGGGRCAVGLGTVMMAASDDSDPRGNGRRYALMAARPIPHGLLWGSFVVLASLWAAAGHRAWPTAAEAPTGGRRWFLTLVGGALVLRGIIAWGLRDQSDPFMMVKGVPYSDCMGWLETARHLIDGRGLVGEFAGQRPLYPVLLAAFSLPGWGFLVASRVLNVLAGAAAAGVFGLMVTRALQSRVAGVAAAIAVAAGGAQASLIGLPMSETAAVAAAIVAMALLWRGGTTERLGDLFWGGALHGMACLICPFTLLSVPLSGLTVAFGPGGWKRFFLRGGLVAAGLMTVLIPWVVRQKLVWGIGSISINSSLMLYAPVSPGARYSPDLEAEAIAAGVKPGDVRGMAHFYGRRYAEEVRRDPARYARIVAQGAAGFLRRYDPSAMDARLLVTISALAFAAGHWRRPANGWQRAAAGLLPAAAWAASLLPGTAWLALAGTGALALPDRSRRLHAALLLSMVAGAAVMDGLTSGALSRRLWSGADWAAAVLGIQAIAAASRLLTPRDRRLPGPSGSAMPGLDATALAFSGTTIAAVAVVGFATLRGPQPHLAAAPPTDKTRTAFLRELTKEAPALTPAFDKPEAHWCGLVWLPEYRARLAAGEASGHWSRAFARRDAERTVIFARNAEGESLTLQIPGDATAWPTGIALIAGVWNLDPNAPLGHETRMLEVVAAASWQDGAPVRRLLQSPPALLPPSPPPAAP